ncbi:apiosidase-like domain-containing protein [Streptomyces acidicola]|uniref:DUF4038 domain-containing protein n=1 Tax=Streptomyces acidicola TaxID=2596892 RepID=A0A5N8WMB6_9ACTN|nr:DUF4038 domain-containing protein [Streptomyces acidicola]MPY48397.1 DUF4038 domain-containing protein [Streptomyces acidicola]
MTVAWQQAEITLGAGFDYANPYTDVEVWADFTHDTGMTVRRPAFWDGGRVWRVRFAPPLSGGRWIWRTHSSVEDPGLGGRMGELEVRSGAVESPNPFLRHGFWRMSPGGRNLVHADATPALLVADTAWALPWRATEGDVRVYAADRASKGFNAVLLMTLQPDMDARGPQDRTADEGFDVAFEDLPDGHLNRMRPSYFQYFDRLHAVLLEHGIAPVLQPVFQGFGWKGLRTAGAAIPPVEYARYCRYLLARYGAAPAVWLVGADGSGSEPQVSAGGREIEAWDAYGQPTGVHYRPHARNDAHQDAPWLDFQWCQTGHRGEHVPERVADMWRNLPAKAVANGEPTYENTGEHGRADGWWQGHEAWSNLCAGGTMGVIYGAAGLWQWRLHAAEPGHQPFFLAPDAGWREALDFAGSRHVGMIAHILAGLPLADMVPDWQLTFAPRGLSVPGRLYVTYAEHGGPLRIHPDTDHAVPRPYRVYDPLTGEITGKGHRHQGDLVIPDDGGAARVFICYDGWAADTPGSPT